LAPRAISIKRHRPLRHPCLESAAADLPRRCHVWPLCKFPPRRSSRPDFRHCEPHAQSGADLEFGADHGRAGRPVPRWRPAPRRLEWGLIPYFAKDLKKARKPINARSETIAKSGMFRAAFTARRCLVPAPAYYEWRDDPDVGRAGRPIIARLTKQIVLSQTWTLLGGDSGPLPSSIWCRRPCLSPASAELSWERSWTVLGGCAQENG